MVTRLTLDCYARVASADIDICAGEIATNDDVRKIIGDQGKVVCGAKDIVDGLTSLFSPEDSRNAIEYHVQMSGVTASISCVDSIANGLYINILKFDVSFPSSFGELDGSIGTLNTLLIFRKEVYDLADIVKRIASDKSCPGQKLSISSRKKYRLL